MGRRDSHLLVELARLPWWVSVVAAVMVYILARWVVPGAIPSRPPFAPLAAAIASHAHWLAIIFLLPVPFALFNHARRERLVEGNATIERIRELSWRDFERLVGEAFRRQGYRVNERGGGGADGGVDLELRTHRKTTLVQCKRWKTWTVGVQPVRELYGVTAGEKADAAIFVTSGSYTPDAIAFARGKPITLIDGRELVRMLGTVNERPATRVSDRPAPQSGENGRQADPPKHVPGVALPELPPARTSGPVAVAEPCPRCGGSMVRRTTKKGPNAGNQFWGCSRYPACRGTRDA